MHLKFDMIFYRHESYLKRTDSYTDKMPSGTFLTYACTNDDKVLMTDVNCTENCIAGYDIECFNGNFLQDSDGFPAEDECIDGLQCDLDLFTGMSSVFDLKCSS